MWLRCVLFFVVSLLIVNTSTFAGGNLIRRVFMPQEAFNPSLAEDLNVVVDLAEQGEITISILDRDNYLTNELCRNKKVSSGVNNFSWNGTNQSGQVVPNEAYTLKIDFHSRNGQLESYVSQGNNSGLTSIRSNYYDRQSGILSYELPQSSRVHIQAGTAVRDPATGNVTGPVYRTVVNREPRPAGKITEFWTGYEQNGDSIFIPDLKDFAIAIAASQLPENSILTYGNSAITFLEYASKRTGKPVVQTNGKHGHHAGLLSIEDVSPTITLTPTGSTWSAKHRAWKVDPGKVILKAQLEGTSSQHFVKQPGKVFVFLDGQEIQTIASPGPNTSFQIELPARKNSTGRHTLAVNWASEYGPTAVGAIAIESSMETARK